VLDARADVKSSKREGHNKLNTDSVACAAPRVRKVKRTFDFDSLFTLLAPVLASSPVLLAALLRPKTSAALREKVMLGATSVTDCRYCAWGHGHWAMANGVSLDEVNQILGQQTASLQAKAPAEAAAILFAQHYAEHLEQFDPAAIDNLRLHYSDAQVAEILAYARTITLGGLAGNTLDALVDRLRGMVRSRKPS
jgi:AhpD family alkylhydroperoxidase